MSTRAGVPHTAPAAITSVSRMKEILRDGWRVLSASAGAGTVVVRCVVAAGVVFVAWAGLIAYAATGSSELWLVLLFPTLFFLSSPPSSTALDVLPVAILLGELLMRGVAQPLLEAVIPSQARRILAALVVGGVWAVVWVAALATGVPFATQLAEAGIAADAGAAVLLALGLSYIGAELGAGAWWQRALPAAIVHWGVMMLLVAAWHYGLDATVGLVTGIALGVLLAMIIVRSMEDAREDRADGCRRPRPRR